ncbi:MAG: SpoIIE family protein phosphatase [Ignavibacteria bacterium]|nr:SpoIIE family protein phosphatase [Ignavibacteria bacterium]
MNFVLSIAITYFFLYFLTKWTNQIKRKNIKKLNYLYYLFIIIFGFIIIIYWISPKEENNSSVVWYFEILLLLSSAVLFSLIFGIKIWIPYTQRRIQKNILLYSFLLVASLIVFISKSSENYSGLGFSNYFFSEFSKFFGFILLVTYIRTSYFSIVSLPFSKVLEKKIYEVNSLSYLSRIVRNFNNLELIYETIAELTFNTFNHSPVWIQIYKNNSFIVKTFKGTSEKQIFDLQSTPTLFKAIKRIKIPKVFGRFIELQGGELENQIQNTIFESFCIIPIFFKETVIGHLIVANTNPYQFDEDDLDLLISYVEALSISIEGNFLLQETIEKERMQQELLLAKEIQRNFLPKSIPKLENVEIEVFFKPSDEIGGDFYDFILLGEKKILILIGDVSGKGMSASFYMALLKGIILSCRRKFENPRDLFVQINSSLFKNIESKIHITMAGLFLDLQSKSFEFIRAGHTPAIIKSNGNVQVFKPDGIGTALVNSKVFEKNLNLASGEVLGGEYFLLFTDGLPEILADKDISEGINKLKNLLLVSYFNDSNELKEKILSEISNKGTKIDDDITFLIIRIKY